MMKAIKWQPVNPGKLTLGEERLCRLVETDAPAWESLPATELAELRNVNIRYFYVRVCRLAEKNMQYTGTVSGAHWNAMQQIMNQMGIDTSVPQQETDSDHQT